MMVEPWKQLKADIRFIKANSRFLMNSDVNELKQEALQRYKEAKRYEKALVQKAADEIQLRKE